MAEAILYTAVFFYFILFFIKETRARVITAFIIDVIFFFIIYYLKGAGPYLLVFIVSAFIINLALYFAGDEAGGLKPERKDYFVIGMNVVLFSLAAYFVKMNSFGGETDLPVNYENVTGLVIMVFGIAFSLYLVLRSYPEGGEGRHE